MAFVPLNTNNSNLANYNSVNSLMLDYQGFKKAVGTSSAEGWVSGVLPSVSSVTYNGNRSYDITFAGPVDSYLSPGMRLKTVRQVAAPTQCTSLNGSTQYFNRTSASVTGMTFTDDFVVSAWVKLNAYGAANGIASRYNGTSGWVIYITSSGQVILQGNNAGGANLSYVQSYQSIPLNKWVHITAQLDMSAFTATTTTSYIMIDGINVPAQVLRGGTNPTSLVQAGNLEIGSYNGGTNTFNGKIAQVAIFSAKVTQATMQGYISQGLAGIETNLISAYSFNNSINDLNTTNANNLTAQSSATATNADSPFSVNGSGTATGTDDYAIVTKVSSTVATVLVAESNTIPTSGGVSATYISTQKAPYNMPISDEKWIVEALLGIDNKVNGGSTVSNGTWYTSNFELKIPVGEWTMVFEGVVWQTNSPSGTGAPQVALGTSATSSAVVIRSSAKFYTDGISTTNYMGSFNTTFPISLSAATTYIALAIAEQGTSATITFRGGINSTYKTTTSIRAKCAFL